MNNVLAWFGAAVVALLAALFAVPAMIDWNGYRGVFEEEATRVLGRDVRLGGSVNLRLLPAPYVSFQKMRISDPGSQTGEPLFRADSFTMWLAISPLLQGVLQANQVELHKPVVKLAVDDQGTGNWSTLQLTPGTLPFVPADVMLNSVKLVDGEIGLVGPKGNELAKLEAVNGEFAADTIRGPYRFRGKLKWSGEDREVRFASASPDANGDVRFKTSVTGAGAASSYILDGRAMDLGGKPRFTGELAAKIVPDLSAALRAPDATPTPPAPKPIAEPAPVTISPDPASPQAKTTVLPPPPAAPLGVPLYDFRSKVEGDATTFKLADISVTSEGTGPPQLITGQASLWWADKTRLDLTLSSKWLDLDSLFGINAAQNVVPLEAARGLFDRLMRALPAAADTNVKLAIDQVNLGGDQISNVKIAALRAGGPLELSEFQVGLPGSTHLVLNGKLAPGETAPKFEGTIGLKGQSLLRFLAWGFKSPGISEGRTDGPFAVNGKLRFSGKMIELAEAKAGVSDVPVMANVRLDLAERRRLTLNLEGQKIDISRMWPGALKIETLAPLMTPARREAAGNDALTGVDGWFDAANTDLVVGIKAGVVSDGERTLRNVETDVSVERGKLAMRSLKFSGDEGLDVELEGEAAELKADAKGTVRGQIVAPDARSAQRFVELAGLTTYAPDLAKQIEALAPLRVAGTLRLGERAANAADLDLDGVVRGGGRLVAKVELDGGLQAWRSAPVNLTARIDSPDLAQSMAALMDPAATPASGLGAGRILLRAAGTPQTALLTFAGVEAKDTVLEFSGNATLQAASPMTLDGDVKVAGRDARSLLAFTGLKLPAAASDVPAVGRLALKKAGPEIILKPLQLTIAGTPVTGELKLTRDEQGPIRVAADLQVRDATIVGLLATLLDRAVPPEPVVANPPARETAPTAPISPPLWPEQGFDFRAVNNVEGSVTVRFASLALEPGLTISNAKLVASLKPGRIEIASLEGSAIGGQLKSNLTIEQAPAGVSLDGAMGIDVASGEADKRTEIASLSLKFAGRALSPAALIADLKGEGQLKLGDVALNGMDPKVIGSAAEAAMSGKGPQNGEALLAVLRDGLKQGQLQLGAINMPIAIADGSMKLAKVELDRPDGLTSFESVVEIATMRIDSEWNVQARLPASAGRTAERLLPPVSVVYTGKLKDLAAIEPTISTAALERELTVRKMERDVDELERLRKVDEQRAKEERDRVRTEQERIKAERAKAAAAAAAAAAVDDPQPDPVPGSPDAGGASVEQQPLPPVNPGPPGAPQPQSNAAPDGSAPAQQAAGTAEQPPTPETTAASPPAKPSPPKRRKPTEDWNPFTNPF